MKEEERCRHPDCIYRNRDDPGKSGRCNYLTRTGRSRTAGLPERLKLPCNCPRYVPDGSEAPKEDWDDWRAEALAFYRAGATDGEIAEALNVRRAYVQKWRCYELKEPPNPDRKGPLPGFPWEKALELYRKGRNDIEIARELGCSVTSVWRWRYKHELFPNGHGGRKKEKS